MTDETTEMGFADAGRHLGVSVAELDELIVLGWLRVKRVINGLDFFLRDDVLAVTPAQIAVARRMAVLNGTEG